MAWILIAAFAGLLALGVVIELAEQRMDRAERKRYDHASHRRLLDELGRQP